MALTQKGQVYSIGALETRQYKDKTFYSRTLLLEQPRFDNYSGEKLNSNFIKFEATREDICASLNSLSVGTKVEVEFIVRGTKYAKKDGSGEDVFTHLEIRTVTPLSAKVTTASAAPIPTAAKPLPTAAPAPAAPAADDYDPDLGF